MNLLKKILFIVLIIALFASSVFSQQDKENSFRWFHGGKLRGDFIFQTDLFCGTGGRFSNSCATLIKDASSIYWNPAQLAFIPYRQLALDFVPSFTINLANFYDLSREVRSSIDNAIIDYRTANTIVEYQKVVPIYKHTGGINNLSFSVPFSKIWKKSAIAFSYSRSMDIKLNLLGNDFSTLLDIKKNVGDQKMTIKFRNDIDMNFQLRSQINRISFALAKKWANNFSSGITINKYYGNISVIGKFNINGIMEIAGNEYVFNDPYDPHIDFENGEHNDLNQSIFAQFDGTGWGFKVGNFFQANKNFAIAAVWEIIPPIYLDGDMIVEQNVMPALNSNALIGEAGNDEEIIDPVKLDLAKLTLTVPFENPTDNRCKLNLPSSLTVGMAYKLGFFYGNINFVNYFGQFSYSTLGVTRGSKFKYGIKSAFDFQLFQIGLGVTAIDEIRKGTENDNEALMQILLPQISLASGYSFNKNLRSEALLFIAPTPVFKWIFLFSF